MDDRIFAKGRAWIELSTANLDNNINCLRSLLPPGCELMPAIKANAYGHGVEIIAKQLSDRGIKAFCVATATEGVELRRLGVRGTILVLGYTHPELFPMLRCFDLTQTVVDGEYAGALNAYGHPIRVHIGIDTGMHRLGLRADDIDGIARLFSMENLQIDGVYTHLCVEDTKNQADSDFTRGQGASFNKALTELRARGLEIPKAHILSSYGLLNYPDLGGAYARVGVALFGVKSSPDDLANHSEGLKPVLSLKTRVASVRKLKKGESMGYGLAYTAKEDKTIAALSIGYGDGVPRALSCGVGRVLINGKRAKIIGRVCMDQTMVDISGIDAKQGDEAILIGEGLPIEEMAARANTISNEILSRLSERLGRIAI